MGWRLPLGSPSRLLAESIYESVMAGLICVLSASFSHGSHFIYIIRRRLVEYIAFLLFIRFVCGVRTFYLHVVFSYFQFGCASISSNKGLFNACSTIQLVHESGRFSSVGCTAHASFLPTCTMHAQCKHPLRTLVPALLLPSIPRRTKILWVWFGERGQFLNDIVSFIRNYHCNKNMRYGLLKFSHFGSWSCALSLDHSLRLH